LSKKEIRLSSREKEIASATPLRSPWLRKAWELGAGVLMCPKKTKTYQKFFKSTESYALYWYYKFVESYLLRDITVNRWVRDEK